MSASRRSPANGSTGLASANGDRDAVSLSRAEKFDDEKKRIIDSCFTRREPDGAFAESYITHVRITEDALHPSAPPPPESPPENKKSRAIIVSVKRSGRVRLHKARENNNGTFSIGKTWVLDDLIAIESFAGATPTTYEDQRRKEWAGDTGVLVTVQKPYFWQTATSKEKDFFIGSLVKIYRKYTKGREPQLTGFTATQLAEFGSSAHPPSRPSQAPSQAPSRGPSASTSPAPSFPSASHDQPTPPYSGGQPVRSPRPSQGPNGSYNRDARPPSSGSTSTREVEPQERPPLPVLATSDSSQSLRPQEPAPRLPKLRSGSSSSSRQDGLRSVTPRNDPSLRPPGPNQSVESLLENRDARSQPSVNLERPRADGTYSAFPREKERPPAEQPVLPGPKSPDRRPGSSNEKAQRPASPKADNLPERRRPPLLSTALAQNGSEKSTSGYSAAANGSIAPNQSEEALNGGPPQDQAKRSAADFFMAASRRMKDMEPKPPIASELISETPTEIKDISQALSTLSSPSEPPESPEETHRPGLGPMIRKKKSSKDVANVFRKAAVAHNAFRPRAGGARDRLRDELARTPNTPDGIHGVFVAPSKEALASPAPPRSAIPPDIASKDPQDNIQEAGDLSTAPSLEVKHASDVPEVAPLSIPKTQEKNEIAAPIKAEPPKQKRPSDYSLKYAKALDIDPLLLEGRTVDVDSVLSDFGWTEGGRMKKSFQDLQTDIRRDLAKIEAGNWLGSFEYGDERVLAVDKLLDKAVAECDELDGLLTLYNVELGTLADDVAYIEAQSQGLQVQTANQRLLQTELNTLLQTITISPSQLSVLRDTKLGQWDGIQEIGTALVQLYRAMLTIDPTLGHHNRQGTNDQSLISIGNEVSTMRAVQEKKDGYLRESIAFIRRFNEYMLTKIERFDSEVSRSLGEKRTTPSAETKMELTRRDTYRADFRKYSAFVLFAREVVTAESDKLLDFYVKTMKRTYEREFKEAIVEWRKSVKQTTSEEQETLFSVQKEESEGIGRRITVKRSKTFRDSPRSISGDKSQDGRIPGYLAFANALSDMSQAIFLEQNFVVDLFHLSSLENADFPDVVENMISGADRSANAADKRTFDPDRNQAKLVKDQVATMFSFWPNELQLLIDQILKHDKIQAVGLMFSIETRKADLADSDQEYITSVLDRIHTKVEKDFLDFIEDQIRAIRSQMVKINKRKGVVAFMRTFPIFAANIETMLSPPQAEHSEVRGLVNDVYVKINKAMFDTLKIIAKHEGVVLGGQRPQGQAGADTEDKDILNYHILLIENMNHYVEGVDPKGNSTLIEWSGVAAKEMAEHMDSYLSAVIRRPLGKLLDFIESTESLMAGLSDRPSSIANKASHQRSNFKKLLSNYDSKEVARGIDTLKKRINKHFGEADEPSLSHGLINKVFKECSERYLGVHDRISRIIAEVYEGGLDIEFKRGDVTRAFAIQ